MWSRALVFPLLGVLGLVRLVVADTPTAPRVVVSIAPLHSLVAGIMAGVGEPVLMVRGYASPHEYQLRPSDAEHLSRAELVVWVGEALESFLKKPLASLASGARVLSVLQIQGLTLLPARVGGAWQPHAEHAHHQAADTGQESHWRGLVAKGSLDPHVWLDPGNAARIVEAVTAELVTLDPGNAPIYEANRIRMLARLAMLDRELQALLRPVQKTPYVVFHDAYQYFEHHFGLNGVGSILVNPDRRPGARRLTELRQRIRELGARCLFSEPQFESALVATVTEDTGVRMGSLDPLGATEPAGPNAYFRMMRANGRAMWKCLSQ
jgi:zinc transport system substrate-binding protein